MSSVRSFAFAKCITESHRNDLYYSNMDMKSVCTLGRRVRYFVCQTLWIPGPEYLPSQAINMQALPLGNFVLAPPSYPANDPDTNKSPLSTPKVENPRSKYEVTTSTLSNIIGSIDFHPTSLNYVLSI